MRIEWIESAYREYVNEGQVLQSHITSSTSLLRCSEMVRAKTG